MARSKKVSGEIGEKLIIKVLRREFKDSFLLNNITLKGKNDLTHQIDHILIRENGIFVIETKNYKGKIEGKENDYFWTYISKEQDNKKYKFYNPIKQNLSHIKHINRIIYRKESTIGFVVFIQDNAKDLGIYKVCGLKDLITRIPLVEIDKPLTKDEQIKIYETLKQADVGIKTIEHVTNINNFKVKKKDEESLKASAIESRICPKCGEKIYVNGLEFYCKKCGFRFFLQKAKTK